MGKIKPLGKKWQEAKIEVMLRKLLRKGLINPQGYKTYISQVKNGNIEGCILGLTRKGLIKDGDRINIT